MRLGATEDGFIDFAVRVLGEHGAERTVGTDGTTAVADGKKAAFEAVLVFDEMLWALDELTPCRAGAQHLREIGIAEDIAEEGLRVAGHPAVALRDGAFGIDGDELVGTILLPNARQSCGRAGEVIDKRIEGTEGNTISMAALHPDVEEAGEEFGERGFVEIKLGFDRFGGPAGERRVDLEALEAKFLSVVAIKSVGSGVDTALVEHGDDADVDPGALGFAETLRPDRGVSISAAAEELAMGFGKSIEVPSEPLNIEKSTSFHAGE